MTKRDYELIAGVLRESPALGTVEPLITKGLARSFANALANTNPRFDRERFIAACEGRDSTDSADRKVSYR